MLLSDASNHGALARCIIREFLSFPPESAFCSTKSSKDPFENLHLEPYIESFVLSTGVTKTKGMGETGGGKRLSFVQNEACKGCPDGAETLLGLTTFVSLDVRSRRTTADRGVL